MAFGTRKKKKETGKKGTSIRSILIPAGLLVLILQVLTAANTFYVRSMEKQVDRLNQQRYICFQSFDGLKECAEQMAEKAQLYVNSGQSGVLESYHVEYRTGEDYLERVDSYLNSSTSRAVTTQVNQTTGLFQKLQDAELHAMLLSATFYEEDVSGYTMMDDQALTEEEAQQPASVRHETAMDTLSSDSFRTDLKDFGKAARLAEQRILTDLTRELNSQKTHMTFFYRLQWILTGLVLVVLLCFCLLLYLLLVMPLEKCTRLIEKSDVIPETMRLEELRRLARIHNQLQKDRAVLEGNLRSLSLTDALTNLPNRLAFENYVSHLSAACPESSVVVFSLDVNGLKKINDTLGHVYGDELLRKSAACIEEVFSDKSGKNCFRFGGDEFAAFWLNTPESDIEPALEHFRKAQQIRGISIAVGYAYADRLGDTTIPELYQKADDEMYRYKAEQKRNGTAEARPE